MRSSNVPQSNQPILTRRLGIRLFETEDLSALTPIMSNPLVTQYLPLGPWRSAKDAKAWLQKTTERTKNGRAAQYIIERRTDKELVGTCLYFNYDASLSSTEFGYVLDQAYWRQGYMFEAMSAFIKTIVGQLKLSLLYALVEKPNTASLALLAKLGFEITELVVEGDSEVYRLEKHVAFHKT